MKEISIKAFVTSFALIFAISPFQCEEVSKKEAPEEKLAISQKLVKGLEFILQTDKMFYRAEEPIALRLTITNKTEDIVRLTFPSVQIYDFVVKGQGRELWRWSKDRMFAMMLSELMLKPNQSLVYEETWTQKDNEGKLLPPGKYEIIGILKTHPESVSQPVAIEIKG